MSPAEVPFETVLCWWGERRYDLRGVRKVTMTEQEGFHGTDVTPGEPDYLEVVVTDAAGERHSRHEHFNTTMVREMIAATQAGPRGASG